MGGPAAGKLEKINLQSNLHTLRFAQEEVKRLSKLMDEIAAQDERATRLIHLPGFGVVTVLTVLGAIGEISRFADP